MKISHHISFNNLKKPYLKEVLDKLDIKYKVSPLPGNINNYLITFDIVENEGYWDILSSYIVECVDIETTIFSEKEIYDAEWLRLIPINQSGFPEPDGEWFETKPNMEIICSECGLATQQSEFLVKKEPNILKMNFWSLIRGYTLFADIETEKLLKENEVAGYRILDLLLKTKPPAFSKIVKQILPTQDFFLRLIDDGKEFSICKLCGKKKYMPHRRGFMEFEYVSSPDNVYDISCTQEWFGDGRAAYQEIIVSRKLAHLIVGNKLKGVQLKPIKIVNM